MVWVGYYWEALNYNKMRSSSDNLFTRGYEYKSFFLTRAF